MSLRALWRRVAMDRTTIITKCVECGCAHPRWLQRMLEVERIISGWFVDERLRWMRKGGW